MTKAWTDKKEYSALAAELAVSEGPGFERQVLPLLRLCFPGAVGTPALRSFDRSGVDHLVWSDTSPFPLVAQCKGFQVLEQELGDSQVSQCRKSIHSFRKSTLRADIYLLIHNRVGKDRSFREAITAELETLVASGQVARAELWDRQRLLREAFNAMLALVRDAIANRNLSIVEVFASSEPLVCDALEQVPLKTCSMVADQYRLTSISAPSTRLADPSKELLESGKENLALLIGEAGFGKTTAALRALELSGRKILFVPAAMFSVNTQSTKDLLEQCIDIDEVLSGFEESDRIHLRRIARPVIHYVFKDKQNPVIVLIDGIDESVFFSRRGGIQQLLNALREVRVPVVLTARSEFWESRLTDFGLSFGTKAGTSRRQRQRLRMIELLPWGDEQIELLTARYRDTQKSSAQKKRIGKLLEIFSRGDYEAFFGDIPRRPLFLRFILETMSEQEIRKVGRAELFFNWARLKVVRDIRNPMRWSGPGRAIIVSRDESVEMTMELSFTAMTLAASAMTLVVEGALELLPSCTLSSVTESDPGLRQIADPIGLLLNSLLVPLPRRPELEPLRIRFAHRAFQEFFLARFIEMHPHHFRSVVIPDSVKRWIDSLRSEGLVGENRDCQLDFVGSDPI